MHLLYALQTEAYETARSSLRAGVSEAPSTLHHGASLGGYLLARLFTYWTLTCCYLHYPLGRLLLERLPVAAVIRCLFGLSLVHSYSRSRQLSIETVVDLNGYYFWSSFFYITPHLAAVNGQLFQSTLPTIPIQRNLPPPPTAPLVPSLHRLSQIPPQPLRP